MLLFDIYISPTDLFLHLCSTCFFLFLFFKWLICVASVTLVDIHSHMVLFETNHLWPQIRYVPVCSSQDIKTETFSLSYVLIFDWKICWAEVSATWTPVQLNTLISSVGTEGPRCDFSAPHQRNPTECCQQVISLAWAPPERKSYKEGRNHDVVDRAHELRESCGGHPAYMQSETHLCCFPGQVKTIIAMNS